jgi:hypothetical protein
VKRRLFNAGALISLIACLGALVLGVRSHWRRDNAWYLGPESTAWCGVRYGGISMEWSSYSPSPRRRPRWIFESERNTGFTVAEGRLWRVSIGGADLRNGYVVAPIWPLVLLFATPPMLWRRVRRRGRVLKSACPACGYDLRGTPSGGGAASGSGTPTKTCPECGAASAASPAKA